MGNALRLGGMAAILALTGATAAVDSAADPSQMRGPHRHPADLTSPSAVQDSVRDGLNPHMPPLYSGMDGDVANSGRLHYMPGVPIPTGYGYELNLISDLQTLHADNANLQKELDATRAQVAELLMRLETMREACEDAASEDGCPVGCACDRCCGNGVDIFE